MRIVCNGSIAFDHIMTFKDYFKNHILPDKVHVLSVSFNLDSMERRTGGCGANICYNLALLGERPLLLGSVGKDFDPEYRNQLESAGVDTSAVKVRPDEYSATGFVTTDLDDNQIWAYYPGAMFVTDDLSLKDLPGPVDAVIIAPNDPKLMVRLAREARELGHRYVWDPGQSLTALDGDDLMEAARGAWIVIGNDYEMEMIRQKTNLDARGLLDLAEIVVCTMGAHGSRILTRDQDITIAAVPANKLVDPTGSGDAYRAGLVLSLLRGLDLETAGRVAALAGTYAVEVAGPQEHRYTLDEFSRRYEEAWGTPAPLSEVAA
jgi:adenosine kinase